MDRIEFKEGKKIPPYCKCYECYTEDELCGGKLQSVSFFFFL